MKRTWNRIALWMGLTAQEMREAWCAWFGHALPKDNREFHQVTGWARGLICKRCKHRCEQCR